jgi:phage terminase small subunit
MSNLELNMRQRKFVEEYFRTDPPYNATKAAIAAGYSKKTAYSIGNRLLKNVEVKNAIDIRAEELFQIIKEDQLRVLLELQRCAHFDIRKLFDENGRFITNIRDMPYEISAAIKSIDILRRNSSGPKNEEEVIIRIKMVDKLRSLELIGKVQGLFSNRVDIPGIENLGVIRLPAKVEEGAPVPDFDNDYKRNKMNE